MVLHAIAEVLRLRILELLKSGEQCECALSDAMELPLSMVSVELAVLQKADLVEKRAGDRWNHFSLSPKNRELVLYILGHFRDELSLHPAIVRDRERFKLLGEVQCAPQPSRIAFRFKAAF